MWIIMPFWSAQLMNSILTWLECPSTINKRLLRPAFALVAGSKTFCNYYKPKLLQVHPFAEAAKKTSSVSSIWSTQLSCRSCDSPLYIRATGIYVPSAQMQAISVTNSQLPSVNCERDPSRFECLSCHNAIRPVYESNNEAFFVHIVHILRCYIVFFDTNSKLPLISYKVLINLKHKDIYILTCV